MLFSELSKLTKGECTTEEYEAVNAVYMSLDDMSKEEAAALWRKLYARKHREERKRKDAESRDIDALYAKDDWFEYGVLPNGDGLIVDIVERRWDGFSCKRNFYVRKGMRKILIAEERFGSIRPAAGNPYKLTRRGKLIPA